MSLVIYTIGHSNRSEDEFVGLLRIFGVESIADVRTVPHSAHNPQFSADELAAALAASGIGYRHYPGLGGFRHPDPGSRNTGWQNERFRGYADHMRSAEFLRAIDDLMAAATSATTAVMCAEAVPWRCHRRLIADALTVRGAKVCDILSRTEATLHAITPFAKVDGFTITYP